MRDYRPLVASARVLCVGPDSYLTDLLRYALTREGCAVQVAASGGEALTAASRWRPHAAIVDGDLPDLGGGDLAAQLRGRHGTAAILLTAHTDEDARTELARSGSHHLTKPFRLHELVGSLAALLQPAAPGR
jgi:two-component system OmpR family response regulator